MDFKKVDDIVRLYATREYPKKELANKYGMTESDITTVLHLNNFHYGIKRNINNMPSNKLYNFCISARTLSSIRTL